MLQLVVHLLSLDDARPHMSLPKSHGSSPLDTQLPVSAAGSCICAAGDLQNRLGLPGVISIHPQGVQYPSPMRDAYNFLQVHRGVFIGLRLRGSL